LLVNLSISSLQPPHNAFLFNSTPVQINSLFNLPIISLFFFLCFSFSNLYMKFSILFIDSLEYFFFSILFLQPIQFSIIFNVSSNSFDNSVALVVKSPLLINPFNTLNSVFTNSILVFFFFFFLKIFIFFFFFFFFFFLSLILKLLSSSKIILLLF